MVTTSTSLTGELLCLIIAQSTLQKSIENSLYSMNLYLTLTFQLFSWYSVTGLMGMVQSCARRGSDLTLGTFSLPEWSSTGRDFLEADVQSLSVFKGHWDNSINKIISFLGSPEVVRLVNKMIVLGPF